jgi:putative ABC transport system substrate-binding protein
MRRREFISLLGGAAAAMAGPLAARAQQAMPVIGWLHSGSPGSSASTLDAFRKGLGEIGFIEGRNITIEYRWAEDRFDALPELASDLVRRNVALIFVGGGDVSALAAKSATATIPIVFAIGADPVKIGLVNSLNRPGGNATGISFLATELRPKTLELVRDLLPKAATVAVLANPNRPGFEQAVNEISELARGIGLRARILKAGNEREIDSAFATLTPTPADALLILSDPVYVNRRDQIARLAASYKVPTVSNSRAIVVAGGLISYGASLEDSYRQAGNYAGRILKGAKPADLPVMQPTRFQFVVNLKTAKALGIDFPPSILVRADEVIE